MKPEVKVEGDVLKIRMAESGTLDKDADGAFSVKGSLALEVELDGSEIVDELLKSSTFMEKLKEKLAAIGIKV